jgi:hypothetical protein
MTGVTPIMTSQSSHVSLGCFLSIGYSYALLIRFSALLLRRLGPPRGLPGSCQNPALNHAQLMYSAMLPFLPSGVPQRQAASKNGMPQQQRAAFIAFRLGSCTTSSGRQLHRSGGSTPL